MRQSATTTLSVPPRGAGQAGQPVFRLEERQLPKSRHLMPEGSLGDARRKREDPEQDVQCKYTYSIQAWIDLTMFRP